MSIAVKLIMYIAKFYRFALKRFDRALGAVCLKEIINRGEYCSIEGNGTIIDPGKLTMGSHVHIGRNFFIRATGGVSIGSYSHISRNVTIHTVNHNINGDFLPYDRNDINESIIIGQYVWIGMGASILPGVTIGNGAVIGMNTTISKDVEENSIVVGSRQRVVGYRNAAHAKKLNEEKKYLLNHSRWANYER
jgi:acetyltransferase-like isoleucine patch superfamily enzyme